MGRNRRSVQCVRTPFVPAGPAGRVPRRCSRDGERQAVCLVAACGGLRTCNVASFRHRSEEHRQLTRGGTRFPVHQAAQATAYGSCADVCRSPHGWHCRFKVNSQRPLNSDGERSAKQASPRACMNHRSIRVSQHCEGRPSREVETAAHRPTESARNLEGPRGRPVTGGPCRTRWDAEICDERGDAAPRMLARA